MTTRTRITATPLYPGSFFPEDGRPVELPDASFEAALAAVTDDGGWFALQVTTVEQKRWDDGEGGELWKQIGAPIAAYRIYVGEEFTAEDIESWPTADQHDILLSNMRGNDWPTVVKTRRGNFQPVEHGDVVIAAAGAVA